MIYKFLDNTKDTESSIEFFNFCDEKLVIIATENEISPMESDQVRIELTERDLTDLIDSLLKIKKEIESNKIN